MSEDLAKILSSLGNDNSRNDELHNFVQNGPPPEQAPVAQTGVPPLGEPSHMDDDFTDAVETGKNNMSEYTALSNYEAGDVLQGNVANIPAKYADPTQKRESIDGLRGRSGGDLMREGSRDYWLNEQNEEDKNIFMGIATQQIESIDNPRLQDYFKRSLGDPEKEADVFAALVDYSVQNDTASPDLIQYLRNKGVLKDTNQADPNNQTIKVSNNLSKFDLDMSSAIAADFMAGDPLAFRGVTKTVAAENHVDFSKKTDVRNEVVHQTNEQLNKFGEQSRLTEDQLLNMRTQIMNNLSDYGEGAENYLLVSMEPRNLVSMKRMSQLQDIPAEAFLNALRATATDVRSWGDGRVRDFWTQLGLSQTQQTVLRHAIISGTRNTTSGTVRQMSQTGNEKVDAENSVKQYIDKLQDEYQRIQKPWPPSEPLILPQNLKSEHLTNEFLLKQGFKVAQEKRSWWKKGLSAVYDKGKDLVGGVIALDEIFIDNVAENALSDALYEIDMSLIDDPYKEASRQRIFEGFREDTDKLNRMVEEAEERGVSGWEMRFLKARQGLANVQQGTVTGIWSWLGGTYDTARAASDWGVRKATNGNYNTKGFLPSWEELEFDIEKQANKIPGYQSWLDDIPDGDKVSTIASYSTLRDTKLREDSKPGGVTRRDLMSVYLYKANSEEKQEIEDAIGGLFDLVEDENRQWHYASMEQFNDLVLNKDYTIAEALDESINMWGRMRAGLSFGTFNLLDFGIGKAISVPIKSTGMALKSAPRLTSLGNQVDNITDLIRLSSKGQANISTDLVDDAIVVLEDAAFELGNDMNKALDSIDVIRPPDANESTFEAFRRLTTGKDVRKGKTVDARKVREVSDNFLGRTFQNVTGQLTIGKGQLPKEILDKEVYQKAIENALIMLKQAKETGTSANLAGLDDLFDAVRLGDSFVDQGRSIKNIFKVTSALNKSSKLATLDSAAHASNKFDLREITAEIQTGSTGANLGFNQRGAFSRLKNSMFGRTTEGAKRDYVANANQLTMNSFGEMMSSYLPRFKRTRSVAQHNFVRGWLEDLQTVDDSPTALLNFVRGNKNSDVLYQDHAKALDILRQIDLDEVPSLKKGLDVDGEDLTPIQFWNRLNAEMTTAVNKVMLEKFGLTDEVGAALGLQNGINKFTSKIFLERPAFAVRNWVTNKSLGILDSGVHVTDMLRNTDEIAMKEWGDLQFIQKGISAGQLGTETQVIGRGETDWLKVMLGHGNEDVKKSKGWRKALYMAKGGGIPLIGGGLPFIFARELSGYMESVDRMRIIDKAGHRWYRQFANEESITRMLNQQDPEIMKIFNSLDDDGAMFKDLVEALQNPANVSMEDFAQVIRAGTEDAYMIRMNENNPAKMFRELGFPEEFMKDADLDMIASRFLKNAQLDTNRTDGTFKSHQQNLRDAVAEEIRTELEVLRANAIEAGFDVPKNTDPTVINTARRNAQKAVGGKTWESPLTTRSCYKLVYSIRQSIRCIKNKATPEW